MLPKAKQAGKLSKSPVKRTLTGGGAPKNASVQEKVSLWNNKGGGLYGSEKGIAADDSSSHQDVIVTVLSESEVSVNTKKSSSNKSASKLDIVSWPDSSKKDGGSKLEMPGALVPSESSNISAGESSGSKLSRTRSASTPNIILVEPSTPAREYVTVTPPVTGPPRPPMMTRRKYKPPPPQNKLDEELKKASAPPRIVISDGKWVRHRRKEPEPEPEPEPKPKSPPKPKPPPDPKLAWVRPPLIARKDPNEIQPTKQLEVSMPHLPPIRTLTGKLKKPILHQFVPGAKSGKLNPGVMPGAAAQRAARIAALERAVESSDTESDSSDETESVIKPPPKRSKGKKPKIVKPESTILTETTDDSTSDSDETEIKRNISAQKMPPISHRRKLSTKDSEGASRKSKPQRSRSGERLTESALSAESKPLSEPRPKREVRERQSSNNVKPQPRQTTRSQEDIPKSTRKVSYNAGDRVPIHEDITPVIIPTLVATPNRISAWLTATLDPFLDRKKTNSEPSTKALSIDIPKPPLKPALKRSEFSSSSRERQPPEPTARGHRQASLPKERVKQAQDVVEYESTISDSTIQKDGAGTEITASQLSTDLSSNASTPTLKRSGARRGATSPTKHRRAPSTLAETESTISQSVDASTITASTVTDESSRGANSDFQDPTRRGSSSLALKNKTFPSTGRQLSTIASVETLSTHVKRNHSNSTQNRELATATVPEDTALVLAPEKSTAIVRKSSRRPSAGAANGLKKSNTIVSTRSTRSRRSKIQMSIPDIMSEVATEEQFYMPELRTLVGGVIKVLFKAVLSKSDAAVAAGLFSKFTAEGAEKEATRTIHEMGVALERLKSYHNRIPKKEAQSFLIWALGAHKIYSEYVRTWRLGFQDVVVNLVPADDFSAVSGRDLEGSSLADAMPRNEQGYVVNEEGSLVDVAFLLKRPLIRLKGLTKTIKGIHGANPTAQSEDLLRKYEDLMEVARQKVNDEKARMEDQAAARIDTSRTRDPASMGALSGVKIDPNRCVRARDVFEMHLIHSSGQEVISKVEILIRDNAPGRSKGGDILLCQSDGHARWLFLPPVLLTHVSARRGDTPSDLIVMLQGVHSRGQPWQELLQLTSKEPEDATEWLNMLGTHPEPPKFSRATLVKEKPPPRPASSHGSSLLSASYFTESTLSKATASPSPSGIDVPLGEENGPDARRWGPETPDKRHTRSYTASPITPRSDLSREELRPTNRENIDPPRRCYDRKPIDRKPVAGGTNPYEASTPRDLNDAIHLDGQPSMLRRSTARTEERNRSRETSEGPPVTPSRNISSQQTKHVSGSKLISDSSRFSVWMPESQQDKEGDSDGDENTPLHFLNPVRQPSTRDRSTSMPTQKISAYRQKRKSEEASEISTIPSEDASSLLSRENPPVYSMPIRQTRTSNQDQTWKQQTPSHQTDSPPAPPPHRTPVARQPNKLGTMPNLTPDSQIKRRSSSPLKHSWRPDSGSEKMSSDGGSGSDSYGDELNTSASESEDDIMSRIEDYHHTRSMLGGAPPSDLTDDITPSQSASQVPFRDAPAPEEIYLTVLASVSTWNSSEYKPIHNEECLVEIGPGKISAYETVTDHNAPAGYQTRKKPYSKPVVAMTLTPHILLQVLNVHDVLISSIPTWDSRFQPQQGQKLAKVRFHTRHQTHRQRMIESLQLAMHNNPIYQKLERDRPKETAAEMFDRQNPGESARQEKGRSWFGGSRKSGSFRKSNTGGGSTVGNTEYSHRTTSSLRRGLQNLLDRTQNYNIDKSTIFRRSRDGHTSARDREAGSTAPRDAFARTKPEEMNQVVRSIHCSIVRYDKIPGGSRQPRRLGKVTLHVLHAPRGPLGAVHGNLGPEGIHSGDGYRLVVANDSSIILDRVLPPSCFVMDTRGIIVHVFDQKADGRVASTGGVGTLVQDLYCLTSFPNETMRDWLFNTLSSPVVMPR